MLTYAGIPIDELRDLPSDARARLIRMLSVDIKAAAARNRAILRARRAAYVAGELAGEPVSPELADYRRAQICPPNRRIVRRTA